MQILTKDELLHKGEFFLREIESGKIFIYPTDTIYGIGCNANMDESVQRIREIKLRPENPFSIIAPSKKWIVNNCIVKDAALDKLPGPYTLILKYKQRTFSRHVNPNKETIGVRIPESWFTEFLQLTEVPFVTTSVNKAGEEFMVDMDNLDEDIKRQVDYIVYEGTKRGRPSTIIDYDGTEIKR